MSPRISSGILGPGIDYSEVMFPGMEALCRVMATDVKHMAPYMYPSPPLASLVQLELPTSTTTTPNISPDVPFPFLELPLEIRLKIYSYLLPPRVHKIVSHPTIIKLQILTSNQRHRFSPTL